jgi:purine-binding chemotaxis protein CheW
VTNIVAEEIEPAPDFGSSIQVEYILGMAKIKSSVKSLLDIEKVISADEPRIFLPIPIDRRFH